MSRQRERKRGRRDTIARRLNQREKGANEEHCTHRESIKRHLSIFQTLSFRSLLFLFFSFLNETKAI